MRLGGAETLLREVSMKFQTSLDSGKALHLGETREGIGHKRRSVDLAYHLSAVSSRLHNIG